MEEDILTTVIFRWTNIKYLTKKPHFFVRSFSRKFIQQFDTEQKTLLFSRTFLISHFRSFDGNFIFLRTFLLNILAKIFYLLLKILLLSNISINHFFQNSNLILRKYLIKSYVCSRDTKHFILAKQILI